MRMNIPSTIVLIGLFAGSVPIASAGDEQGVNNVLQAFVTAWNQHDSPAMAALWVEDGDAVNPAGRVAQGRAGVEKLIAEEHAGIFKDSTMSITRSSIRFVTEDVAFMDLDLGLTGVAAPEGQPTELPHHAVFLLRKESEGWKIVSARPYVFIRMPSASS